jgi:hypothetical protein
MGIRLFSVVGSDAHTCIRCGHAEAPQPLGSCPVCALNARIELVEGLKRLGLYLGVRAAFE